MKKIILFTCFLLTFFTSCDIQLKRNHNDPLNIVVQKTHPSPENLWLYTSGRYLIGVNPSTLEPELVAKFNFYLSNPLYINGKFYVALSSGLDFTDWAYRIVCLNKDLTLNCRIPVHPNTTRIVQHVNYLVSDSACYNAYGQSGFAITDLTTNQPIFKCESLNEMISNVGDIWGYKNKLYLANYPRGNTPFSISIFDLDKMDFEEKHSSKFCSKPDELPHEYTSILINNNQLWINYYFDSVICVYDLDTNERLARIDLKQFFPEFSDKNNIFSTEYDSFKNGMSAPKFIDGKFHVLFRKEYQHEDTYSYLNSLLIINPETFELEKELRLKENIIVPNEIIYPVSKDNSILLRTYGTFYKFDLTTGELLEIIESFN